MSENVPQMIDHDAPIFTIGVAANLAGMHPQTLRSYDRMGLVVPRRSRGRGRRYSPRDVAKLRLVQHLSQEEGINLTGIQRILELEDELERTRTRLAEVEQLLVDARFARVQGADRVFTAEGNGEVHLGRHVPRRRLALPAR